MKIDLALIDRENFLVQERMLNGETVFLVNPNHIGAKWSRDTLHFRSSLWDKEGSLISASFKKFFNLGEQPDLTPVPTSLRGHTLIEKLDGSTLIVSYHKGQQIVRTRGTVDATALDNGYEIDILRGRYPMAFDNAMLRKEHCSFIYEWVSPVNKIVIDYGSVPDLFLIGVIYHHEYYLEDQVVLDCTAKAIGVKRPEKFSFDSVEDMTATVKALQGKEGLCVYTPDGQNIRKVKGDWYLAIHRFKSNANIETVLDLFVEYGHPSYVEFESKLMVHANYDYECFSLVRSFASQVSDAYKEVQAIKEGMVRFVGPLIGLPRKDAALKIIAAYGTTNRASFCFQLLDGKTLDADANKKLLWQCLKA